MQIHKLLIPFIKIAKASHVVWRASCLFRIAHKHKEALELTRKTESIKQSRKEQEMKVAFNDCWRVRQGQSKTKVGFK